MPRIKNSQNGDNPLRALIWCAVSTPEQAVDEKESLPAQRRELTAICESFHWPIVDILEVPGFSRRYLDLDDFIQDLLKKKEFTDAQRNAGQKLREYLRSGGFDVFVVRDGDRFGRSQALFSRISEDILMVQRKFIFAQNGGGLISESNGGREWITMQGYRASKHSDDLMRYRDMGMASRAKRGLPTSSGVAMTHVLIRSHLGEALRQEVDRSKQRLWDDLYDLFVNGELGEDGTRRKVSYRHLERELFKRGHSNENGKPWQPMRFYTLLTNPTTYGHSARHHRLNKTYGWIGLWILEPGHEIPDGVEINYNTHEPVWSGEQFNDIKAEFLRRITLKNNMRHQTASRFAGLLVCGECAYYLISMKGKYSAGLRCVSRYNQSATRPDCSQNKWINEKKIVAWFTPRLKEVIASGNWTALFGDQGQGVSADRIDQIEREEAEIKETITRLIHAQIRYVGEPAFDVYQQQIDQANERLKYTIAHRQQLVEQMHQSQHDNQDRDAALANILRVGVEQFWKLPNADVHQTLSRLMGSWRLMVLDGQIIRIVPAPSYRR